MHRPCMPHHVRMDVLWDFRANILCHTSVFCKKCSYRIRRHFLPCPMNHSIEKWRFAMVICGRMELVQILLAMLDCLAEKGNCADFAPFPVQIRNWVFCIKPQITNFHIEELTAPGRSIVHEDHKYQIPQIFRLRWVRLLKQRSQ